MEPLRTFSIRRVVAQDTNRVLDQVAVEEPLAISLKHWQKDAPVVSQFAVTMRTPGQDEQLCLGLLYAEGLIRSSADVVEVRTLGHDAKNELQVEVKPGIDFEAWRSARNGFVSSSCGVCGKQSWEAIQQETVPSETSFQVEREVIYRLPEALRQHQPGFAETGGLHAAAIATREGQIEAAFEDVGRHNALDKLIGWALLHRQLPLHERIVFMSSRGSFELVQKTAMAGAPVLACVGGPSSLAIETARALQMTLIGFLRATRFNVYSGEWRIHS